MAKSIRSKIKRKSRREFRETIGQEFRERKMKQIQDKLKSSVEKQTLSMDSLERLSRALAPPPPPTASTTTSATNAAENDMEVDGAAAAAAAAADGETAVAVVDQRGENAAPKSVHKKSNARRKHAPNAKSIDHYAAAKKNNATKGEGKRRPKYFVQF